MKRGRSFMPASMPGLRWCSAGNSTGWRRVPAWTARVIFLAAVAPPDPAFFEEAGRLREAGEEDADAREGEGEDDGEDVGAERAKLWAPCESRGK
jgi:hypothetical protein